MHPRLHHGRRQSRATSRDDKTSIDLLEHVRGGIQVESSADVRLYKHFRVESPDMINPESEAETTASVRRGSRPRRW